MNKAVINDKYRPVWSSYFHSKEISIVVEKGIIGKLWSSTLRKGSCWFEKGNHQPPNYHQPVAAPGVVKEVCSLPIISLENSGCVRWWALSFLVVAKHLIQSNGMSSLIVKVFTLFSIIYRNYDRA